jgi:hypothetical protein
MRTTAIILIINKVVVERYRMAHPSCSSDTRFEERQHIQRFEPALVAFRDLGLIS